MKHAELRSIVHSVADSLGSGIGLLIGYGEADVYGDARRSNQGAITIDFLHGAIIEGEPSEHLVKAVALYRDAMASLCLKAGGSMADFTEAKARFWSDALNEKFVVIVAGKDGRCSTTHYEGRPGRRVQILDALGRRRPKPSAS